MTAAGASAGATDAVNVVFTPSGRRGRFAVGTTVLEAARRLGVDLESVCGGRGLCGRCQVVPASGEFAKHAIRSDPDHLAPLTPTERQFRSGPGLAEGRRLGCCAELRGDVLIDVPADSQVHRQLVRKPLEARSVELDPPLRLFCVEVAEPSLAAPSGDLQRLRDALEFEWGLTGLVCVPGVLRQLQGALRQGRWRVTVAVRDGHAIVDVRPGFHDRACGLAVDLGSTTIAAHLCDLASGEVLASGGRMNPQIRYGEDLMSRVSYCMMHADGVALLGTAVRQGLAELCAEVIAEAGVERIDVHEMALVANPVMHHLLLGIDPVELGGAPFALATDEAVEIAAGDLGLALHPEARVYVLPCIAGHVGADTAGVLLAEAPHTADAVHLLVDVGTNAEIVLGNRERLLAASSPTGPAFEGAQIEAGQRAAPGAIERVRIDPVTLEPRFRVIGCDLWSDEPGFFEQVGVDGVTGICGSGIIEVVAEMFRSGILDERGAFRTDAVERSPRVRAAGRSWVYGLYDGEPTIRISQNDVRQIQLAKAALRAGIELLRDRFGRRPIERIRLAGAFGSHIDVAYALLLGMLPDAELSQVSPAGNAAGVGARIALLNRTARREIEALVRQVEKVETATESAFQRHFVEAMAIPHATQAFPSTAAHFGLPGAEPVGAVQSGGRRRRRAS